MSSLEEDIQNWIVNETDGLIKGRLKHFPTVSSLKKLTEGKNKEVWKFVTKHVKSKQSVAQIKKILQLRQAKKEREEISEAINKIDIVKYKVNQADDKAKFMEQSVKSLSKHVISLNTSVEYKKDENSILQQKCSVLELTALSLQEKSDSLYSIIDKLYALLNKSFANEKTKYFKNPFARNLFKDITSRTKEDANNDNLMNIINEMMLIVQQRIFYLNLDLPATNLVAPVAEIMSYTLIMDLVNLLKDKSQFDLNSLQNKVGIVKQGDVKRMSETYLQSMKRDLLDSCFQSKRVEGAENSFQINDIQFNKNLGEQHRDYLLLHFHNECLADSIRYLEKILSIELDFTLSIEESNAEKKSKCQDIEIVMGDFFKILKTLHLLFDTRPEACSTICNSLDLSKTFIDSKILPTIPSKKDNKLIEVVHGIDNNFLLYLKLQKNKDFMQDFLKDSTFVKLNFPVKIWEFLTLEPFQNQHLSIERLALIKSKLSLQPVTFNYELGETSTAKQMVLSIEDNACRFKVIEKNLYEVKKSCTNLEIVLKDWWYQNAQFIPTIEFRDKTLKMWLAILDLIE